MMHKFKVKQNEKSPVCSEVTIDGNKVRCTGYKITHYPGEVPVVQMKLLANPELELDAYIKIDNAEEIARSMNKDEFDRFCEIWKEIHTCKPNDAI